MKKYLFFLISILSAAFCANAQLTADWKTFMPFDAWPTQVIETPKRVYFLNRTFQYAPALPERRISSNSLFYYDKEGDEIISVNERSNANSNAVACVGYNAAKKYLLVVYTDCNIDFIYDDGRVFNLGALKITSIPGKKEANSVTFDNARNRAYIATSFGYIALNDDKHEVAESRTYGENVESVARCGSNIVLCIDGKIHYAPASQQRFNIDDYTLLPGTPVINAIIPLNSDDFYGYKTTTGESYLDFFKKTESGYEWNQLEIDPKFFGIQQIAGGEAYRLTGNVRLFEITKSGNVSNFMRPNEEWAKPAASLDKSKLWTLTSRKGLRAYKNSGDGWSLTNDYMRPNSPATYIASSFAYVPEYGMLCNSNGADLAYNEFQQLTPTNISALKGGFWKEYGPFYSGSNLYEPTNFSGLSIDPKNTSHAYLTKTTGGLMRINLAKPDEVLILGNTSNQYSKNEGFIKIVEDQAVWDVLCRFTPVSFDSNGTMWSLYNNRDASRAEMWYWPTADRLATTSAATYRPMKKINVPVFNGSNLDCMIALTVNKNILVMGGTAEGGTVLVYDHRGTPDNTSDDRYVLIRNAYDQDGGSVYFSIVNNLYEDPATGLVWILSQRGPFTFNPATIFEQPDRLNRIKVARNDGTNLADYLLNEVNINHMTSDGEGRKWFSTSNGLVCTSADGRTILAEFTTDNSYLPGNSIYATGYNAENNSMMVATEGGLVEMYPSGSGGSSSADNSGLRAYPNPVEPDYYGWVRIDNIPDGSLVKITDAKGGIVKELGPAQGGSVEWDVSGLNNTRVSTGVYYIMVSPGAGGDGSTQISKILVLN